MQTQDPQRTAKLICDVDGIVRALLASVPATKPGQRQLRADCNAAATALQILRMAIAMNRPVDEVRQATHQVLEVLRLAQVHASSARIDQAQRQAVQLAGRLMQEVATSLAACSGA